MGRKSQLLKNFPELDESKYYYTTNICKVAWLKMYNIHPVRVLQNYDNTLIYEYEKTERLHQTLQRLYSSNRMQRFLECLKEVIHENKIYKQKQQPKEDDRQ